MPDFSVIFRVNKGRTLRELLINYAKVVLVWCPLVTLLFTFAFGDFDHVVERIAISTIVSVVVATSCFVGAGFVNYLYNSYRRRKGQGPKEDNWFWGLVTSYPFMLPGLYFGFMLAGKFSTAIGFHWNAPVLGDYTSGLVFGIMVSGLFSLSEVLRDAKEAKQTAELKYRTLENEKLKAQISALTAQMNPHLLFNSLNTIASTITTDPRSAEDMVVQLSELYRGILRSAKGDMHSLESELALCKSYLEIERKRFGPRIEYRIEIDAQVDASQIRLPVLLLQPLVENAVKHGLSPKVSGGLITINIQKNDLHLILRVVDNGVGIDHARPSKGTGTGLVNCASRVRLKYGDGSDFVFARNENNETVASIHLPHKEAAGD